MFKISITTFVGYPIIAIICMIGLSYFVQLLSSPSKNIGQILMISWTVYNVISVIMYAFNGLPISCYIDALQSYFFPMLFFYIGNNSKIVDDSFYKVLLASLAFLFLMGFYLYFATPSYYINYQAEMRADLWYSNGGVTEDNVMSVLRFSSFMSSSYVTSALSISLVAISFSFLFRRSDIKPFISYSLAVVGVIGAVLCQQRIAIGSIILVLPVFSWLGIKSKNKGIITLSIILVVLFVVILGTSFIDDRMNVVLEQIIGRLEQMNFSKAMSDRTGQYDKAATEIISWIATGKGMGAGGHSAVKVGSIGVCDGEFFHLLLEFGIIGFMFFIPLLIMTLIRGAKLFRILNLETFVVFYILLTCIGANGLSQSYLIGPLFWFCVGRIWNKNYINQRLNEQSR